MTGSAIFFFTVSILLFIGYHAGLYLLFKKAGKNGWEALIPVYKIKVWSELVGRGKKYFYLMAAQTFFVLTLLLVGENIFPWYIFTVFYLICVLNVFYLIQLCLDLSKSYGRTSFLDNVLTVLFPGVFFIKIALDKSVEYKGQGATFPKVKKSQTREWADAIAFAVYAATIIRWATFEAFTIPTSSMEKSLLIGDFLFVSKLHYGPRTPMTPIQMPLTHRFWWGTADANGAGGKDSYVDWIQLPSYRLPGFTKVKQGDVVVFNFPGDKDAPADLRTNYIKRCVGLPGDTFQIKETQVYTNGNEFIPPKPLQYKFFVHTKDSISPEEFHKLRLRWEDITPVERYLKKFPSYSYDKPRGRVESNPDYENLRYLTKDSSNLLGYTVMANETDIKNIKKEFGPSIEVYDFRDLNKQMRKYYGGGRPDLFMRDQLAAFKGWDIDHLGPYLIPKKGLTIPITKKTWALYQEIIIHYEGNTIKDATAGFLVNGIPYYKLGSYTFKQDYYFMMGDNRHNSSDSRIFGFVPEDHIVGKAVMIWFSYDGYEDGVRWDRLFNFIE